MTAQVEVKFFAQIADEVGMKTLLIDAGQTVTEAIGTIERTTGYPLHDRLGSGCGILINGRSYKLRQKESFILKKGDKMAILPTLGGG